jgi:hypothetical protein
MASPVKDIAWLQWIAGVITEKGGEELPGPPSPSGYSCLLEEQPDHLLPEAYLRSEDAAQERSRLFVNPRCRFAPAGQWPLEAGPEARLLEKAALPADLVWVGSPVTTAWWPFWLGRELSSLVESLRPGDLAPSHIPQNLRHALSLAEVLVPEDYESNCHQSWADAVSRCALQLGQKGYIPFAGLIPPLHIAALRRYCRYLIRTGQTTLGDNQCERRHVAHNDSVARFFHHQITAAVAELAGQALKPSYVYLAGYEGGAQLHKHVDREQCELSITLCVDYSPEPRRATPWPIHLDTAHGRVTVFQALGDALLYRGRELPHYRDALPAGHTSTSIFFHYVREDFSGPLD